MKLRNKFVVCATVFGFIISTSVVEAEANDASYWLSKEMQAQQYMKMERYRDALDLFMKIAEETSSSYSQFQIAWIYHNGLGIKRNCQEAARWYTHAANQGDPAALNNLYSIYVNGCEDFPANPKAGISYLKKAAQAGNSRAQSNLSSLYHEGKDIEGDPYQAYDLAKRSADQGDITGIKLLSQYYAEGFGVPANIQRAFELMRTAAGMDVEDSDKPTRQVTRLLLAGKYYEGNGTPKNLAASYQWLLLAAAGPDSQISDKAKEVMQSLEPQLSDSEHTQATTQAQQIGSASQTASKEDLLVGLSQAIDKNDRLTAISLAKTLAAQNEPRAQLTLGQMYYQGYGPLAKDLDEAYLLFKKACQAGEWFACLSQVSVLSDKKHTKEALDLMSMVIKNMPQRDDARMAVAKVLDNLGRHDQAEELASKVLKNDPINQEAQQLLNQQRARKTKQEPSNSTDYWCFSKGRFVTKDEVCQ